MHIQIGKALQHFYMLKESLILWKYINVLDIKENQNFKRFTIYTLSKYLLTRELTLTNL